MAPTPDAPDGVPDVTGGPVDAASKGLSRAAEAAGGVLRDIFGGLPWEMDPSAIVDVVAGGGGEVAGDAAAVMVVLI